MSLKRSRRTLLCISLLLLPIGFIVIDSRLWRKVRTQAASGTTVRDLAPDLHVQWVRDYPPLKPAWPDQPKMQFDAAYRPIALGGTLLVGSSRTDSVTALDLDTGADKWRFVTDGPVRFAPTTWQNKIYFVSDDGFLYCVDADRGALIWKFRGGPSDRKILGNERLISTWPARGAPVVADGAVYFAAGIWPFMGIFIHALDAQTGEVAWTNSGEGAVYMKQPHQADAFAGIAPQGGLVVAGDKLLIPGGRSVPACYDRRTGKRLYYHLADHSKIGGGSEVVANDKVFINCGAAFDLESGYYLGAVGGPVVLTPEVLFTCSGTECRALDLTNAHVQRAQESNRSSKRGSRAIWTIDQLGSMTVPPVSAMTKAGDRLFAGTANQVFAVDLPLSTGTSAITWQAGIEGHPVHLLATEGRLIVTTLEGRIYCFGPGKIEPRTFSPVLSPAAPADQWTATAGRLLETAGMREGYGVAWGIGSGRLITELARQSRLHLIVIDPDGRKVNAFRNELIAAGLYGERVAVLAGNPETVSLPPYLASLTVSEDLRSANIELDQTFVRRIFEALRPYGGIAWLPIPNPERRRFIDMVTADERLGRAHAREDAGGMLLSRDGPLPGSANWTHEHADAANTRVSKDQRVKAPLGLLWFGGPSHDGILPRHGHGPQPQVIDGRLIIEGVDMLRAMDIYTGRVLWEKRLPGVGSFYNNLAHQPGANASGTNYISTPDGIYIVHQNVCLRLDPSTGKTLAEFKLPPSTLGGKTPRWGYINVADDLLVGGADPMFDPKLAQFTTTGGDDDDPVATKSGAKGSSLLTKLKSLRAENDNLSASKELVVMNRHSGQVLWRVTAQNGFRHNGVCIGGGCLYAIDRLSGPQSSRLEKQGKKAPPARLLAMDLATGKEIWHSNDEVFGTWLSYSSRHDVLIEAGRMARDTIYDEPKGMRAYRADSGKVLWYQKSYGGPAMIHGDMILKDQSACHVLTGEPWMRDDPLTGKPVEWTWTRGYGCNTPAASEHLLTFRSGAAGFFDLCHDGGTGNFGGFRSSCTNNLIVAGGVLSAPDYTRTCTCSYQNQTSLALVPMPDNEMWTYFSTKAVSGPVRRLGINFGAPGSRKADDGTLWLEYPSTSGKSPTVPIQLTPPEPAWFRGHSSRIKSTVQPWVGASGARGLTSATLTLGDKGGPLRNYTVRLYFVEPDSFKAGERVFGVGLQGRQVLKDFDIIREAGEPNRVVVKEFKGVRVWNELTVSLSPSVGIPVLCGIEITAEGW
jgi:outer membrane protein assembly factor BamB